MKLKLIILFILGFMLCKPSGYAQVKSTAKKMSPADSMKAARIHALDSAANFRKYRSSKRYKDSVAKVRKVHTDSIKTAREERLDSMHEIREKIKDSLATVREKRTDSLTEIQEARAEKVESTNKYKNSKRFADSVAIVKRTRSDSMKREMTANRDRMASIRKHEMDSLRGNIKHTNDSLKSVRTHALDSLKIVRKRRTDSLNKMRLAKTNTVKTKEKVSEEKKKIALELKMKSKREAFTNKNMLKKKWSPMRRFTQNSFTHYNYYYNANRKMEEAKANMLRGVQKENFDSLIKLYPFDPDRDSSLLAGDMDSIIRRISVGIQIHDPRVKWANDLYLIMGEAYYYKGNYENAAATFKYIINSDEEDKKKNGDNKGAGQSIVENKKSRLDFLNHKSVHNDAILWLAQTFVQAKQVENGQAVLSLLSSDAKLPENMVGKVAAGKAFAFLADKNYTAASDELLIVMEDDNVPDWLRMRAAFLNGQLMQQAEKYDSAVKSFERCLDFFPKLEMDFFARKLIAYNTLMGGRDVAVGMKPLKKILNDPKYSSYYDQIYFVLGKIAAQAHKPDEAVTYLKQSATTPKATKAQKALSYAEMGDVYYSQGKYGAAKGAYDSAAKFSGGNSKDAVVQASIQKSKGLGEISQPTAIITEQDSLLELAAMTPKEQRSEVKHAIQRIEKAIRDSISKAKEAAAANGTETADKDEETAEPASNWYFSNPILMQQGAADFKKKWGNRPLTDNWRRAQGQVATAGDGGNNADEEGSSSEKKETVNGLPSEESLLAKIPNTAQQKAASYKTLQRAYVALATAYLKQLDDYVKAGKTLDTLDKRFPDHAYKEEELYLRYQLAVRQSKLSEALAFSNELLKTFPNSKYAPLLKPKEEKAGSEAPVAAYYEETYNLVIQHRYQEALAHFETAKKQYTDPTFAKRFDIAEAMAYAGMGNYNQADSLINKFVAAHPSDTLTAWANSVSAYIKDVKANGVPSWYKNLPVSESGAVATPVTPKPTVDSVKPKPVVPKRPPDVPYNYHYTPEDGHYCLLVLNSLDSRTAKLKKEIMGIDSTKGLGIKVIIDMYSPVEVLVLVKNFSNAKAASGFLELLKAGSVAAAYKPDELKTFTISAANYRKMFYEQDSEPYFSFYKNNYR